MNERLYIRLAADPREPVRWGLLAPGAADFADTGSLALNDLARLAELGAGKPVIVLVPGTDVLFTAAKVPTRQTRQMLKALPYLLEEQLVGDVEDQHFAVGARQADGSVAVAVVARTRLDGWLEVLRSAGLVPDALVPDAALLPAGASVLLDGPLGLLRLSEQSLFALESELVPELLALRLAERGDGATVEVRVHGASELQLAELRAALGTDVTLAVHECWDPLLLLAGQYGPESLNLLQGAYAKRQDRSAQWLYWRPAALVAGVALVVHLLGLGLEAWQLDREREALRSEIGRIYAQAFPGEKLRDPVRDMKKKLEGLSGGGGGFLSVLQQIAEALAQVPGIRPSALSYESNRGEFRLDLNAPDFDTLERLRQTLSGLGLAVESGPASAGSEGGYQGRLVIRKAP